MFKIGLAAIAAATIVSATAVSATESSQDRREGVSLQVSAQNVDFANPDAVARFRRDVERQINEACNPGDRVGADMKPDFKCRREMAANLEPTVTQLAMRATQGDRRFVGVE